MKVKNFFGTNLQDAMKRAQFELGDEILLIDSQSIPVKMNPNKQTTLTQITVAIPDDTKTKKEWSNSTPKLPYAFQKYFRSMQSDNIWNESGRVIEKTDTSKGKMATKKPHIEPLSLNTPLPRELINQFDNLINAGVAPIDADYLIKQAFLKSGSPLQMSADEALSAIKKEAIESVDMYSQFDQNPIFDKHIIALVGATGVGKTSILMKMATHPDFFKGKKIAIISTDHYRIAARETLQIFSLITNIPFVEAVESKVLARSIRKMENYDVILIDTPGRSPFFPGFFNELQSLLEACGEVTTELVISASADLEDIFLNVSLWSLLEPAGLIITKIDETSRPGKIISLVRAMQIPLHFISEGQRIPNDLCTARGRLIWERIAQVWQ